MASCIIYPTVNKDGVEVQSKLFKDLLTLTQDRELSKNIYGIAKDSEFIKNHSELRLDSLGEVTFNSLQKVINFQEVLNPDRQLYFYERYYLESIDLQGNPIKYDSLRQILPTVLNFNEREKNYIANIQKVGNKYQVNVKATSMENLGQKDQIQFSSILNTKLLGLIRKLGFDATIMESNSRLKGLFDPLNAQLTAEKLFQVIKIVEGLEGEEAFPEEVAHLVIEGLMREPLVQRVLTVLTPDVVKQVLGDQYSSYYSEYEGSTSKLQREAAGKLLADQIKTNHSQVTPILFKRLWNIVKNIFQKLTNSDIQNAIQEANRELSKVAKQVLDETIIPHINKEDIFNSDPLYSILKGLEELKKLSESALAIKSKELQIKTNKSKSTDYDPQDVQVIKEIQDAIYQENHAQALLVFLNNSVNQINALKSKLDTIESRKASNTSDIESLGQVANVLRDIKEFKDGYGKIITTLKQASNLQISGDLQITADMAADITNVATQLSTVLDNVEVTYKKLRFNVVYNFLKIYWGEDKIQDIGLNKGKQLTLSFLLTMAEKDISFLDTYIKSMSDSSDPILSTLDKAVKISQANRDSILQSVLNDLKIAHNKLTAAGYNDQFMYERDSKGKLTGRLISDIDFAAYEAAKEAKHAELVAMEEKHPSRTFSKVRQQMLAWEGLNTIKVVIDEDSGVTETLPNKDYRLNVLKDLKKPQRDYYDSMIASKQLLESLLPAKYINTYRAVQIRNDALEVVSDNLTNPKEAARLLLSNMKDKFVRRPDNDEYGLNNPADQKDVKLDIAGKPIELLPIYYTMPLEDTQRLSVDFTSSIMAYAAMAINFNEMSKIIDVLELTRDVLNDRDVQQLSGNNKLMDTFKVLNQTFTEAYTKKAGESNSGRKLNSYYAAQIYGKRKVNEGTVKIGDLEIGVTEAVDAVKEYTSLLGLGLNTFGAISNVLQGKIQIFIESVGGEFYTMKNAANAEINYWKYLEPVVMEANSTNQHSKLGLMIDKFDALEDFYGGIKRKVFYKGAVKRILGSANVMFMNGMGEHYLHTKTMLAILDNIKVKNNKTQQVMSLFDAFKVENTVSSSGVILSGMLQLKDDIVNLDGTEITEDQLVKIKLKIGKVNQMQNGAFNDMDKGAIHRYSLGRLAMQFRQWMPSHYQRRFGSTRYDSALDSWREGYYNTLGKFIFTTLKELKQSQFQLAVNYHNLTLHEKANLKKSLTELTIFAALCILVSMIGPAKDKKGNWAMRMLIYQLNRMKLETGASTISPNLISNFKVLIQTPAAAIKTVGNLIEIFEFYNMFVELESGRYKGYSVYEKNLIELTPLYGQINKVLDLKEEDYMYKIFNQAK